MATGLPISTKKKAAGKPKSKVATTKMRVAGVTQVAFKEPEAGRESSRLK